MGGSNICFAQNWETERSSESILIFAGPVHHEECCLPAESSWPSLSVFGWRPLTSNGLVHFDGWFGWFGYCGNGSKAIQYPRGWRLTRTHLMLVIGVFSTPHKCLGSAARENLGNGRRSVDSDVIHHFYPLKEKDSGDWMTIKPQGDAPVRLSWQTLHFLTVASLEGAKFWAMTMAATKLETAIVPNDLTHRTFIRYIVYCPTV